MYKRQNPRCALARPVAAAGGHQQGEQGTNSQSQSHHHHHRHGTSTGGENVHSSSCDAQHVHRLEGQCGHRAIIHQPKEGTAHIDFVVGDQVECFHGIEPLGKNSDQVAWPSKYKCSDVPAGTSNNESTTTSCIKNNPSMAEIMEKLESSGSQILEPKIYQLKDIDLDDAEWQLDNTGTIDEGLAGLFKLGETPVEETTGAA